MPDWVDKEDAIRVCEAVINAKEVRLPGPMRGLSPASDAEGWEPNPPMIKAGARACLAKIQAIQPSEYVAAAVELAEAQVAFNDDPTSSEAISRLNRALAQFRKVRR